MVQTQQAVLVTFDHLEQVAVGVGAGVVLGVERFRGSACWSVCKRDGNVNLTVISIKCF